MALESPKYTIISTEKKFEIREYQGYVVAVAQVDGDYNSALNNGFRILADYIFGNNTKKAHIAMTAPVTQVYADKSEKIEMTVPVLASSSGSRKYRISFMMPAKYSIDTLPQPNNKEITFNKVDGHRAAVIRFSGILDKKLALKKQGELESWLKANRLVPKSDYIYAQYNPPWIPGPFRRNEILAEV
jgi:DNA gyrase inhibitor GyrI